MSLIITRGLGNSQKLTTQGYGIAGVVVNLREVKRLDSTLSIAVDIFEVNGNPDIIEIDTNGLFDKKELDNLINKDRNLTIRIDKDKYLISKGLFDQSELKSLISKDIDLNINVSKEKQLETKDLQDEKNLNTIITDDKLLNSKVTNKKELESKIELEDD
jgi:hypothetical protein